MNNENKPIPEPANAPPETSPIPEQQPPTPELADPIPPVQSAVEQSQPTGQTPLTTPSETLEPQTPDVAPMPVVAVGGSVTDKLIQQPKKGNTLLRVTGVVVGLAVLVGAGFGTYYFGIRVSDKAYDDAVAANASLVETVDSLESDAKEVLAPSLEDIATEQGGDTKKPEDLTSAELEAKLKDAKVVVKDCQTSIAKLGELDPVAKDAKVRDAYETAESALKNYCQTLDELVQTAEILVPYQDMSKRLLAAQSNIKSSASYDAAMLEVKTFFQKNISVPYEDYNDKVYSPIRNNVIDVISGGHDVIVAVEAKNSIQYSKAMTSYSAALRQSEQIKKEVETYKITPPKPPTEELNYLKQTLQSQKSVFFR